MFETEEKLAWTWNPSPAHSYLNLIRIDSFQEISTFGGTYQGDLHPMIFVQGSDPLPHNRYHCWTICIQNIWNAEVMLGVATENAEFIDDWNYMGRIGRDGHSWTLSSRGSLYHHNYAVVHEDYRLFPRDLVTVHLDLIKRTLMFAINNKVIGLQYQNLPHGVDLYPVVGVAGRCVLTLVSAYMCESSLHLMSLVTHIIARCKARAPKIQSRVPKFPDGTCLQWCGTVSIDKLLLPPGLMKTCKVLYPWFFADHQMKPYTRAEQRRRCNKHKMPKVIRFADSKTNESSTERRDMTKRIVKSRKCHCGNINKDNSCSHESVLRFFRKRDICYLSSSDDEIFPRITKKNKKRLRR